MQASFCNKLERLSKAGFALFVVSSVVESLLHKFKASAATANAHSKQRKWMKPEVVPFAHRVNHNLKKVATRYGIPIVFSAPNKLAQLCPRITRYEPRVCQKQHAKTFRRCAQGVINEIPLSCGKSYIE